MSKLEEIYTGWKNYIVGNEDIKPLAEQRAKICAMCPINVKNFCSKELDGCGCYIPAKVCSPNSKCPKDFWIS